MLEKAQIATVGGNMETQCNSGGGSKRKEESWRESPHLLGEYLNNSVQIVGRTMDVRDDSGEISDGNEEQAIENQRKIILVAKWRRTWLNCILLFCGVSNLRTMRLDVQQKFPSKVLKAKLGSS